MVQFKIVLQCLKYGNLKYFYNEMGGRIKHYKGGLVLARKHLSLSIFVYRWWWRWTKTKLNVGKSMISLFLHKDLGRDVASRPAASRSYRNLVETCRYIGNIGLLLVGMMRTKRSVKFECTMKKCDSNIDIRRKCQQIECLKRAPKEFT